MDGSHIKGFFLEPRQTFHRQYEALRAIFVDNEPIEHVAGRFGYTSATLRARALTHPCNRPRCWSRTAR